MKRIKKRMFLIPAVLVALSCLCIYLFFWASQTDTDADIQAGENGTKSLIAYFTRSGNIPAEEAEDTDALSSASMMANGGFTEFAAYPDTLNRMMLFTWVFPSGGLMPLWQSARFWSIMI